MKCCAVQNTAQRADHYVIHGETPDLRLNSYPGPELPLEFPLCIIPCLLRAKEAKASGYSLCITIEALRCAQIEVAEWADRQVIKIRRFRYREKYVAVDEQVP